MAGHGTAAIRDLGARMTKEQFIRYGGMVQALPDRVLDRMTTADLRKHYPAGTR
ncbi:hypothetical protein [Actinoplanes awajinensis]|uniref:hypothetical protein n=1 Tax=Actinoplanes awajinensis TaxID=135946 RepID=UPI000AD40EAF|nr:hypothetical protein [Actinoplanes awajinensis]